MDIHSKAQTSCWALAVFLMVGFGDSWCKIYNVYACALLKISKSPFCTIPFQSCLFAFVFVTLLWIARKYIFLVLQFNALQSNQKENNTRRKRRYGIILPVFNLISLKWTQSVVIFPHILQAMQRRKMVKMVNLGKEIENKKKWKEKKLGPCMNVFINFDPDTTLDLCHPKKMTSKRMTYWRKVNLKNGQ